MNTKHHTAGIAAILAGASLTALIAANDAKTVASAHREILLQTTRSWNGKPYAHYPTGQPQLTTIRMTIAPHTALQWHTHPFPNSVYVLSGTLTLHDKASGKTQVVHQGDHLLADLGIGGEVTRLSWRKCQKVEPSCSGFFGAPRGVVLPSATSPARASWNSLVCRAGRSSTTPVISTVPRFPSE